MTLGTFQNLVRLAENELDFPSLSWSTGHDSTSNWSPDISGPVDSVYKHLREHNLCNTNDYQNIGVNGASSHTILDTLQYVLGRDNQLN
jgi:acyloxyacyl hydrolase